MRHNSDKDVSSYLKFNSCLSGKVAIGWTTSIMTFPLFLMSFMGGLESLAISLSPGTFTYYLSSSLLIILLSYLFGWFFLYPKKRLEILQRWGWNLAETPQNSINYIKKRFILMHFPWSIFLCILIIVPGILKEFFVFNFVFSVSSLLVIAVIGLDFISRFKLWNSKVHEKIVKVAEFQDVHHATMIKNHLMSEGSKFYLQGYYHRHLLHFFGPYIPINLMVPVFEKERVEKLIRRYYGGLGLVSNGKLSTTMVSS